MKKVLLFLILLVMLLTSSVTVWAKAAPEWFPLDQEETILIDLKSIQKRSDPASKDEVYRFDVKYFNKANDVTPTKRAPYEFWILDMEVNYSKSEFATRVIIYYEDWNGRVTRLERHILKGEDSEWKPLLKGQTNYFVAERMREVINDNQEDIKGHQTYYQ
ncbi:MAG: hypothetical protein KBA38_05190 [Negativicutes bacterium]|nr:hypothetical protein [Negativicutes bacterium]